MTPIEELSTALVQQAPELDPTTVEALRRALERIDRPLARSIARIVELVVMDVVDPAIALPALAEACATLAAGLAGGVDDRVLEAARYQIDTLQPVPNKPAGVVRFDVPIATLKRR